jgi:hypothetical protein
VQHALLNVVGPILTRTFIRDTFQSIVGRGTSDAMRRVKEFVRSEQCPPYALKIDVQKYYPSVENNILKNLVRKKIKCEETLWLMVNIIDSMKGLPIGNYTSQHLGNLYLNDFDWWIKQTIKPRAYFRYCDDMVVFDESKEKLQLIKVQMESELSKLQLKIKSNWQIYDIKRDGIDFVGYVFRPERTKLRSSIAKNFRVVCKKLQEISLQSINEKHRSTLMSYKGWVKPANAKLLWRTHTKALIGMFPKQLRGAI